MGDDDHGTTPLGSTHYGMRALFPLWRPPSSEADGGIEALDRHFARLSEAYGYAIVTPERSINALGRRRLREGALERARAVFEVNVARYPRSPNVYDSLGEALKELGELDAAARNFERAVALAEELDHPRLDTFRRHLEEMEP
jgi:tetratricopeptide (TPR) repeat protein